jgi:hypothetical protein
MKPSPDRSEQQLVAALCDGDADAFAALVDRHMTDEDRNHRCRQPSTGG